MQALIGRDPLPGYELALEAGDGEPGLLMTRLDGAVLRGSRTQPITGRKQAAAGELPLFPATRLDDDTIDRFQSLHPRWDVHGVQAEFDDWIARAPAKRQPQDYRRAFLGFAKTFIERRKRS